MTEGLSKSAIQTALPPDFSAELHILQQTASTNEDAKALAKSGAPHGSVVFACSQTNGRGRLGRTFLSPGGGIYFSMILRTAPADAIYITTAAAVAVCRAIESVSPARPQIKWVNDIYQNGRKVCGILAEATPEGAVILGIGINYTGAPAEIPEAGSLFEKDTAPDKNRFAATMISELLRVFAEMSCGNLLDEYRKRSCVLGKTIRYLENNLWRTAQALDIDETGGLVVSSDGETKILRSGEITLRV
ncbi:MAG TPA: biotin--[acetyl-CoA-carboxylase] ligase [Methanocorpusculum sp.]|nr:biotin--[acetyl-CoA-carboxylase] ligase [Methanocorpusculum sp.]